MGRRLDIPAGMRFGKLTVISEAETKRRSTLLVEYKSKIYSFMEFYNKFSNNRVSSSVARCRVQRKWEPYEAVTTANRK